MNKTIKILFGNQSLLLNHEEALNFFTEYFISNPFDYNLDELLSNILANEDPHTSDHLQNGLKVDALGREKFTSKLKNFIDIEALTPSSSCQITSFDNSLTELIYPESLSYKPDKVTSFSERYAPIYKHRVISLTDARLCVSAYGFAIFDRDDNYIHNLCFGDGILLALTNPTNLPALQSFDGTVVPLCSVWSNGYFHWILEVLPKLILITKAGYKLSDVDIFLIRQKTPQLLEFLNYLGIPSEKIVLWQSVPHLKIKKIIFTSSLEHYDYSVYPSSILIEPWVSLELRNHFSLPCRHKKSKRIYIDRENALIRKVINNSEVKNLLLEYGFEFYSLESLCLKEKQVLFSCAEIIVGPVGAGFSNLVFCNQGTKVLMFYQDKFETDSFWSICNNNNLLHFHLLCESSNRFYPSKSSGTLNENFLIDIDDLRKSMDFLFGFKKED